MAMRSESVAAGQKRFFKTGKGQYGEGDRFLGIKNPQIRAVVREAWRNTSLKEAARLVRDEWHEVRLCGLLIMVSMMEQAVSRYRKTMQLEPVKTISDAYLRLHRHINNWDLVDLSCTRIVGWREVLDSDFSLMEQWAKPYGTDSHGNAAKNTLWQRRIAMVSTWMLMRHGRPEAVARRAFLMLDSTEDLLHKAAGWMLRELGKQPFGREMLLGFIEENAGRMPSVMLSYATEKLSEAERHHWQAERKRRQAAMA